MAFKAKIDYCGLIEATKQNNVASLLIRNDDKNGSIEKYQPQGQNGDYVLTETFGEDAAPSNAYGLKVDWDLAAGAIKLNKIVSISEGTGSTATTKKYALENVKITTKAGSPVTIEASCQQVEDDAADDGVYWIPALSLSRDHEAQILFSAFTLSGSGCHLTECSADIGCSVSKDDVAGTKISSDCNSGIITVTGKILSTGGTVPTVAAKATAESLGNDTTSNWVVTKPVAISESNPEKACAEYEVEVQLPLVKYRPAASAT